MQISLNTTPNINYTKGYQQQYKSDNSKYNPQFTGGGYDRFCQTIGKKVCPKLFDNWFINKIGTSLKDPDNAVKHFLAVGSTITSAMYIKQTLTNDKMDKDRRQTLAVNQGITWFIATLGSYTMDRKIKKWWNGQYHKYIATTPEGRGIIDKWKLHNEKIINDNKGKLKELQMPELKLDRFLEEFGANHIDSEIFKVLKARSQGFTALRQILVFGFVYRFFVPVAIVKPTNWLCERYLENKKKKQELAAQQNNTQKS